MKFYDFSKCKGHMEVWKYFHDGAAELHYEEDNVICSGMGATLAEMMDAPLDTPVENFQIAYFQVGVSGTSSLPVPQPYLPLWNRLSMELGFWMSQNMTTWQMES